MAIIGCGTETYLYINGISTFREIVLHDDVVLVPVTVGFHYEKVSKLLQSDVDFAVVAVSGQTIASQMRIIATDPKELVAAAWNANWDCILLGAIFHCNVICNVQCDKPVEQLENASCVNVTNYAFRAMLEEPYQLTPIDVEWLQTHYATAHMLLENDAFRIAAHAMASYHWHSMPQVQLAILWSGIEALFRASTEIRFRISLYIANFLVGEDTVEANKLFETTKKLYIARSVAVHGGKTKEDFWPFVQESATLLNRLIRRCAERGDLPDTKQLVFPHASSKA